MSFEPRRELIQSFYSVSELHATLLQFVSQLYKGNQNVPVNSSLICLQSRGESVSRRPGRRAPPLDCSKEVYEFLRRSFEKEEEACTCHQYIHNPQSLRFSVISANHSPQHQRAAREAARRKGHKRSVSYAGHIIVDKPFITENMGNSQGGGEVKGGKRDRQAPKREKRAQFETQVSSVHIASF